MNIDLRTTLDRLEALSDALGDGDVCDHIAIFLHPDKVNEFCDAVDLAIKNYEPLHDPIDADGYAENH